MTEKLQFFQYWIYLSTAAQQKTDSKKTNVFLLDSVQGDHLYGKPGNVRDFDSCQWNVRDFTKSDGNVREVSGKRKWPKTIASLLVLMLFIISYYKLVLSSNSSHVIYTDMINTGDEWDRRGVNPIICLFLQQSWLCWVCTFHFGFGSCTVAFLPLPLTITLVQAWYE